MVDHPAAVGNDEEAGGGGEDQEGAGVAAVVVLCRGVHGEGRGRGTPPSEGGPVDVSGVSEEEDRVGPDTEGDHGVLERAAVERREAETIQSMTVLVPFPGVCVPFPGVCGLGTGLDVDLF